jgi:ABC-2 type transport system permease protein
MFLLSLLGLGGDGQKLTAKKVLKVAGFSILMLYLSASFIFMFGAIAHTNYMALKPAGLQEYLILNNAIIVSLLTVFMGVLTSISVYSLSEAEQFFMSLPIKSWQFFGSKVVLVYLTEIAMSFLIMLPMVIVYGIMEHPSVLFYVLSFFAILLIPVIPVCLVFLILVPLLRVFRRIRRKNLLLIAGGFIGVSGIVAFQIFYQSTLLRISDPAWLVNNFTGPDSFLNSIALVYPPSFLVWKAISPSAGIGGIIYLILLAALSSVFALLTVRVLATAYVNSLQGFGESILKKIRDVGLFVRTAFIKKPLMITLLKREVFLMIREPVYFFNGPFVILLGPLMIAVMYIVQKPLLASQPGGFSLDALIALYGSHPAAPFVTAAAGIFLGTSTMIAPTCVSRDAYFIPFFKSLPLDPKKIADAKILHPLLYSVFGILVATGALNLIAGFGAFFWAVSLLASLAGNILTIMLGLFFDTAFPRTRWTNPLGAFKQNPNAAISIFFSMGIAAVIGAVPAVLGLGTLQFTLIFSLPALALSLGLIPLYRNYFQKRLQTIEI